MPYHIPAIDDNPDADNAPLIYTYGQEVCNIRENHARYPVFAYNYLSLKGSDWCFNNPKLNPREYQHYFQVINELSNKTIEELIESKSTRYRFHEVKLNKIENEIKRVLNIRERIKYDEFPLLFQFGLYTDKPTINEKGEEVLTGKAPRVVFLIGNNGVFHILLLDFEHQVYPSGSKKS